MLCAFLKSVESTCLLAACLFVAMHILSIGFVGVMFERSQMRSQTEDNYYNLEPQYIQDEWTLRRDVILLQVFISLTNASAWAVLAIVVVPVAWMLSNNGTRMAIFHLAIALVVGIGGCMEVLAWLMVIGAETAGLLVELRFNLDNWTGSNDQIGWRTLEVAYTVVHGFVIWVDSFEWLVLSAVLIMIYWSVRKQEAKTFSLRWAQFGLAVGLVCFFHFATDIMRLFAWNNLNGFGAFFSLMTRLLLLPIWLVWLGRQRKAMDKEGGPQSAAPPPSPSSFVISSEDDHNDGVAVD